MVAIENRSGEGEPPIDDVQALQLRAGEAVINANANPSLLTAEQHRDVAALQALASHAATEANLELMASPRGSQ